MLFFLPLPPHRSTIAEIVYEALEEEQHNCPDNDVKHIFISILQTEGLETKEKISGIIDLITSAIETVSRVRCWPWP